MSCYYIEGEKSPACDSEEGPPSRARQGPSATARAQRYSTWCRRYAEALYYECRAGQGRRCESNALQHSAAQRSTAQHSATECTIATIQ